MSSPHGPPLRANRIFLAHMREKVGRQQHRGLGLSSMKRRNSSEKVSRRDPLMKLPTAARSANDIGPSSIPAQSPGAALESDHLSYSATTPA
jgi:hypothetical protein